ncbi:MAG TPA: hypothetical protein VFL92_03335 [Sphingomonas sp.]|nr:hypothetical protein [Sphingomonas sp.]
MPQGRRLRADHVLLAGGAGILLLMLAVGVISFPFRQHTVAHIFFVRQDVAILSLQALTLLALGWIGVEGAPRAPALPSGRWIALLILCAVAIGWAGHYLIFQGYSLTADEQSADIAAAAIRHGGIGYPVPPDLRPYAAAMMPQYVSAPHDMVWVSGYLPVNAALQALLSIPERGLASPLLLGAGLAALWLAARRFFAGGSDAAIVVMAMALTSSQLLTTAMTSYAMTAHFALNMIWLVLATRGGKAGHAGALIVAFLATGLHQAQFHPMFACGFILWFWLRGDRRLAILYAIAYAAILLFWIGAYPVILSRLLSPPHAAVASHALHAVHAGAPHRADTIDHTILRSLKSAYLYASIKVGRLAQLDPLLNLSRFAAWQNLLMLPLAIAGMRLVPAAWRDRESLAFPLTVTCLIGLATMIYQAHGWGYRYLHGDLGGFYLLAGYGWRRLRPTFGDAGTIPALKPLWIACAAALLLFLPAQWLMARHWTAPYVALYRGIEKSPDDVVLVDDVGGAFLEDIVHIRPEEGVHKPYIMSLVRLMPAQLDRLCARYPRIGFIGVEQAYAVGVLPTINPEWKIRYAAALRRYLAMRGCAGF